MILGFYSCSAHNTPTAPEGTDTTVGPVPPGSSSTPLVPGTLPGTPIITLPEAPTADGTVGYIITGFTFTVDSNGNTTYTDTRQNLATSGPIPNIGGFSMEVIPGVTIAFSPFAVVGNTLKGFVTLTNAQHHYGLLNPRAIYIKLSEGEGLTPGGGLYGLPGMSPIETPGAAWDFSPLKSSGLLNCDGFCTMNMGASTWGLNLEYAYPYILIAREDENYLLDYGDSASNQVILDASGGVGPLSYAVYFITEIAAKEGIDDEIDPAEFYTGVPRSVATTLLENPLADESTVRIAIDMDTFDEDRACYLMVDRGYTVVTLEYAGIEDDKYIVQGTIPVKPSADGPIELVTYVAPLTYQSDPGGGGLNLAPMNFEGFYFWAAFD